jgi:UDP-N-acetylglucosamine 2-epimerase (non-hydrolysing)
MTNIQLACVVGARPNFMKMAPLLRHVEAEGGFDVTLIHTGQHYDAALSDVFFEQLEMRRPDVSLDVGSGSHAVQTARILERIEPVLQAGGSNGQAFDWLVVVGDVNSTMAAAIAAAKLGIPVAHVEAGLRSLDRSMPEEINRIVTDSISDLLLVSDPSGTDFLRKEGHPEENIKVVGNLMIDTLHQLLPKAQATSVLDDYGLTAGKYGVVTLHRPSNVDCKSTLFELLKVLSDVSKFCPLVFPVHPRTRAKLIEYSLDEMLESNPNFHLLPPMGYLEFVGLTSRANFVVTDSGGLQEETSALGIPCLTMRENTERPITVSQGSSCLVGNDPVLLAKHLTSVREGTYQVGKCPELWDGKAASRIATALKR